MNFRDQGIIIAKNSFKEKARPARTNKLNIIYLVIEPPAHDANAPKFRHAL